jgi:hypothetical protein
VALNFPSNPVVNQVFQSEGITFVWSGAVWHVLDPFPWAVAGAETGVMTPDATRVALNAVPSGRAFSQGVPQNFLASRSANANYQWTGSRPLMVAISFSDRDDQSNAELRVGPTNVNPPAINLGQAQALRGTGAVENTIIGVVPAGWWYRLNGTDRRPSATAWWEWRNAPA